jgi:hypothetical protein
MLQQQTLPTQAVQPQALPAAAASPREPDAVTRTAHQQVMPLIDAFHSAGGIATGEEISILLRRHCDQPLSKLARWIVAGDIVVIEWRGQTLIPMFQFDLDDMSVKPEVAAVLASLRAWRDSLRTSRWLVAPNAWLNDHRPIDCLSSDLPAVLQTAQAETRSTAC